MKWHALRMRSLWLTIAFVSLACCSSPIRREQGGTFGITDHTFVALGQQLLVTGPYHIGTLLQARRCFQAYYRLTGLQDLRHFYADDCLAVMAASEAEREMAEWRCIAYDSSAEALLAEAEARLKVLRQEQANSQRMVEVSGVRDEQTGLVPTSRQPWEMPANLHDQYTMNRTAQVFLQYHDSTGGMPREYTAVDIIAIERMVRLRLPSISYPQIDLLLYRLFDAPVVCVESVRYAWVREAFHKASVGILGSTQPWYEAMAIALGAQRVVSIDYNQPLYQHPAIFPVSRDMYWGKGVENRRAEGGLDSGHRDRFDILMSISSFEHDGLGRYGDPLAPDGDLDAMAECELMLRPGGTLLLAVPIARDAVVWNSHRVYGRKRLRRLLQGWTVVHALGLIPEVLDKHDMNPQQPVLVLQRRARGSEAYTAADLLLQLDQA